MTSGKQNKSRRRAPIKAAVRNAVWRRYFGPETTIGTCFVCGLTITKDTFHAGHYVARARGGSDQIENLRPVCSNCNQAMGTRYIQAFKRRHFAKVPDLEPYDPQRNPGLVATVSQTRHDVATLRDEFGEFKEQLAGFMGGGRNPPADNLIRQRSERAQALMKEYKWPEAAVEVEAALRQRTTAEERAALYNLLGEARYRAGNVDAAEGAWRKMLMEAEG